MTTQHFLKREKKKRKKKKEEEEKEGEEEGDEEEEEGRNPQSRWAFARESLLDPLLPQPG